MNYLQRLIAALISASVCLLLAVPATAQTSTYAAALTAAGQVIVSDTSGAYRWIVTNPGEPLAQPIGFTWSPAGDRLLFAVESNGEVSLRVGVIAQQAAYEIGRLPAGSVSGGVWTPDGAGVFAASGDQIAYFPADGSGAIGVVSGSGPVRLISPFAAERPYLPPTSSLSPDGRYLFYQTADGRYAVIALDGSAVYPLTGANDPDAPGAGLWADAAPVVAYWGYESTALLNVTHAATGVTLTLDSGRAAPIPPLAWLPGTLTLVYRDATGYVRAADLACVTTGCAADPFAAAVNFLPPDAADVQIDAAAQVAIYRAGSVAAAVPLACLSTGDCPASTVRVSSDAALDRPIHGAAGRFVYTTGSGTAAWVDLACVRVGGCAPQPIGAGVAGLIAPAGDAVVVSAADGLSIFPFSTAIPVYLGEPGSDPLRVRWN